jgi:hypothetical protein
VLTLSEVISTFILRRYSRYQINKPIHYSGTFDHGFYQQFKSSNLQGCFTTRGGSRGKIGSSARPSKRKWHSCSTHRSSCQTIFSFAEGDENDRLVSQKQLSHLNLLGNITDPENVTEFVNSVQFRALKTRLGIPLTSSTNLRHSFTHDISTGFTADAFSQWPESLVLAALRDVDLVHKFADIARQDHLAVKLRSALHPQIDLATEARWASNLGRPLLSFGHDLESKL